MDIKDKKIIVTGGANGLGRCLVKKLSNEKAVVAALDINETALHQLKTEIPSVFCITCDVTNPNQAKKAVDDFCEKFGSVDVLVNNAGIVRNSPLIKIEKGGVTAHDTDMWNKVISTNLSSVFYVTLPVVEKMVAKRIQGIVINVSSICADGNAGQSAYSAAKAGVNALTVTWAKELGPFGIRVAAVAPGFAKTETTLQSMSEEVTKEWMKKTPLRRMADPLEIAESVLFIIQNDFFNGRVLELDGGLRI